MANTTLQRTPINYYPIDKGGIFKDDVSELTATIFKEIGVKCSCNNKTYINKYTFEHQHCKTKKHTDFINKLIINKDDIIQTNITQKTQLKTLHISLGKATQEITNLTAKNIKLTNVEIENK